MVGRNILKYDYYVTIVKVNENLDNHSVNYRGTVKYIEFYLLLWIIFNLCYTKLE